MSNFVQSGNFTRFIAILFLALTGLAALITLIIITVLKVDVNPAVYTLMGGLVGSAGTFFAKASGVVDGATITQNAVNSVTGPMNDAINANPPVASPPPVAPVNTGTPNVG